MRTIRLGDVCSAHRRRLIAARLDAIEEVQEFGLQVHLIVCRRDAVDAGSTILAGQPIGLLHPVQIDDVVERGQRRPPFRPRQIGYPLSVRRQVCGVQSPLPCFTSMGLSSWRPPSLAGSRRARFPVFIGTMKALRLPVRAIPGPLWFPFRAPRAPPVFVLAEALPERGGRSSGLELLFSRPPSIRQSASVGTHGISQVSWRSIPPLPCSKTPAEPARPRRWRSCRCCPRSKQTEGPSRNMISRLTQGFSFRCLRFTSDVAAAHARLASGWRAAPLPGGS